MGLLILMICFSIRHCYVKKLWWQNDFQPLDLVAKNSSHLNVSGIHSESIVAIESGTGKILFSKNPDMLFPPASLTKLVTLYLIYSFIHQGIVQEDTVIPIPFAAWGKMLPKDSSLMFIEPSQRVTLHELMLGLAIPSGNDAAIAVAYYFAGSVSKFVQQMNQTMSNMGLYHIHFEDTNGYSPYNYITAYDFAQFCNHYVHQFPESLDDLHKVKVIRFPTKKNYPNHPKRFRVHTIVQKNHNPLLGHVEGIEGLKTGYIGKSGFNIAVSIKRNHIRLIIVSLGSYAAVAEEASQNRVYDISHLADAVYSAYQAYPLPKEYYHHGITAHISSDISYVYHYLSIVQIKAHYTVLKNAHVQAGDVVGYIEVKDIQQNKAQFPLIASKEVGGNFWITCLSSIYHFFKTLFKAVPSSMFLR